MDVIARSPLRLRCARNDTFFLARKLGSYFTSSLKKDAYGFFSTVADAFASGLVLLPAGAAAAPSGLYGGTANVRM